MGTDYSRVSNDIGSASQKYCYFRKKMGKFENLKTKYNLEHSIYNKSSIFLFADEEFKTFYSLRIGRYGNNLHEALLQHYFSSA